ncbi:hypothetical protein PZH42_30540, partial [Bacteroides cellulosilyticus]|nr:hypothetical protein [Bacteroides cellulosilyticus]
HWLTAQEALDLGFIDGIYDADPVPADSTPAQIWDYRIFIINPKTYEITGYIECPDMDMESGSTEQMVQYGKYVYVNCWSYQNRILKIDTDSMEQVMRT